MKHRTFIVLGCLAAGGAQATVSYNEFGNGDLSYLYPGDTTTVLNLGVGQNTVYGRLSSWGDFDTFAFNIPQATQLNSVSLSFQLVTATGYFPSNQSATYGLSSGIGLPYAPYPKGNYAQTVNFSTINSTPLFPLATPLGAGTYTMGDFIHNDFSSGFVDYAYTLNVQSLAPPPPTCVAPQVLQGDTCVTPPAKTLPQWLKNLALSYEDLSKKFSTDMAWETSFIGGIVSGAETGALEGIKYVVKSLAEFYGLNIWQDSLQSPVAIDNFLKLKGMIAGFDCVSDLSEMDYASALTLCGGNVTGLIVGDYLAPFLHTYGVDPVSPDYKSVYPVVIPQIGIDNPVYDTLFGAIGCAGAYLNGVNKSYDRYSGAYAAGDQASETLQFGAIDTYLTQYGNCMLQAKDQLTSIADKVRTSPELNATYDPFVLIQVQKELRSDGFDPEVIALLQDMGLDPAQIDRVENNILSFDPFSISKTWADTLTADANAVGQLAFVPIPGTLTLTVLGLAVMRLLRYQRRTRQCSRIELRGRKLVVGIGLSS